MNIFWYSGYLMKYDVVLLESGISICFQFFSMLMNEDFGIWHCELTTLGFPDLCLDAVDVLVSWLML